MRNTWKIYMLTLISFFVGTSQFAIVGFLDKVATSVSVSVSTAGQLTTVFALANAIGTPLVMVATARVDRRKQLLLALVAILLGVVSVAALSGFGWLIVSYAVLGVGTGVFVVAAYATAASLAPAERRARAMSNVSLGFSSSLVFGVPIGRVVAAAYDWKWIFWVIGLFTLVGICSFTRSIPSTQGEAPVPLGKQYVLLKDAKIAFSLVVTFFFFVGYSVVNTYITPFLTSVMGMGEREVSVILFALGIASLSGSKLGGLLADRLGPSRTLIGVMLVQVLVLAILSVVARSPIVAIPLLMVWAISSWSFGPTQNFNLLSLAPEASGIVLSLNSSFVQLGFAAGAAIGGVAVGGSSMRAICWIGAAAVAAAVMVASVSSWRTRMDERVAKRRSS